MRAVDPRTADFFNSLLERLEISGGSATLTVEGKRYNSMLTVEESAKLLASFPKRYESRVPIPPETPVLRFSLSRGEEKWQGVAPQTPSELERLEPFLSAVQDLIRRLFKTQPSSE